MDTRPDCLCYNAWSYFLYLGDNIRKVTLTLEKVDQEYFKKIAKFCTKIGLYFFIVFITLKHPIYTSLDLIIMFTLFAFIGILMFVFLCGMTNESDPPWDKIYKEKEDETI